MLLKDAQEMVYDHVVLFTVMRRKFQRRAHNSPPLHRPLSNPQLALRTPAAPFQYHHNHHPSFSVQSVHQRGDRRYPSRENKSTENEYPLGEHLIYFGIF